MRRHFNGLDLDMQVASGRLAIFLIDDDLAPSRPDLQSDSRSQYVAYVDRHGLRLAEAHRYLQPDGSLGASGLPDPKWLLVGREEWNSGHFDDEWCDDCPLDRRDGAYVGQL
jgi:hypothetical protein